MNGHGRLEGPTRSLLLTSSHLELSYLPHHLTGLQYHILNGFTDLTSQLWPRLDFLIAPRLRPISYFDLFRPILIWILPTPRATQQNLVTSASGSISLEMTQYVALMAAINANYSSCTVKSYSMHWLSLKLYRTYVIGLMMISWPCL